MIMYLTMNYRSVIYFDLDLEQIEFGVRCKTCYAFIPAYTELTKESDKILDKFMEENDTCEG